MAYIKLNWTAETPINPDNLNHLETQYDAAKSELDSHEHLDRYYTQTEMKDTFWNKVGGGRKTFGAGDLCDADLLDGYHAEAFAGMGVPMGVIVLWYSSVGTVPSGWHLCDGSGGTVDLRGLFVVGAGGDYNVGDTGGSDSITPSGAINTGNTTLAVSQLPRHNHRYYDNVPSGSDYCCMSECYYLHVPSCSDHSGFYTGYYGSSSPTPHNHSGSFSGYSQENRPPFYALCYIQYTG